MNHRSACIWRRNSTFQVKEDNIDNFMTKVRFCIPSFDSTAPVCTLVQFIDHWRMEVGYSIQTMACSSACSLWRWKDNRMLSYKWEKYLNWIPAAGIANDTTRHNAMNELKVDIHEFSKPSYWKGSLVSQEYHKTRYWTTRRPFRSTDRRVIVLIGFFSPFYISLSQRSKGKIIDQLTSLRDALDRLEELGEAYDSWSVSDMTKSRSSLVSDWIVSEAVSDGLEYVSSDSHGSNWLSSWMDDIWSEDWSNKYSIVVTPEISWTLIYERELPNKAKEIY